MTEGGNSTGCDESRLAIHKILSLAAIHLLNFNFKAFSIVFMAIFTQVTSVISHIRAGIHTLIDNFFTEIQMVQMVFLTNFSEFRF